MQGNPKLLNAKRNLRGRAYDSFKNVVYEALKSSRRWRDRATPRKVSVFGHISAQWNSAAARMRL